MAAPRGAHAQADTGSPPAGESLLEYYRQMALIRAFELRAAQMYRMAKIGGYCHLNLGEEATVVLDSQRMLPQRLLASGFVFDYPRLDQALNQLLA